MKSSNIDPGQELKNPDFLTGTYVNVNGIDFGSLTIINQEGGFYYEWIFTDTPANFIQHGARGTLKVYKNHLIFLPLDVNKSYMCTYTFQSGSLDSQLSFQVVDESDLVYHFSRF